MVEERKHIDSSFIIFYNLYNRIWDFVMPSKLMARKEPNFGPAQLVDILLWKWFPLEPETELLELNLNDLEFFNLDSKMKLTSLKALAQGTSIDLDSMLDIQGEGTQ